jgi:hypothetical protein
MLVELVKVWLGLHVDTVLSRGSAATFRLRIEGFSTPTTSYHFQDSLLKCSENVLTQSYI